VRSSRTSKPHGHLYRLAKWTRASREFRRTAEGALCASCLRLGLVVPSECVDHDPPHNGDVAKFWDRDTWVPLCWSCHSSKTRADLTGVPRRIKGINTVTGMPLDPDHPWNR
jgi:5-methylcytosine-specific restriction endonuclease McrA